MAGIEDFFSFRNTVYNLSNDEYEKTSNYLEPIRAFARTTYNSIYVIDYQKKGFEYVSENPLFLCGHTSQEIMEMGYAFYFKFVPQSDLDLLLKINTVGFEFYDRIPVDERMNYTISYDFHIINQEGKSLLIHQKLTPIFLNNEGKIWKAICIISLSSEGESGNIRVYRKGSNNIFIYDLKNDCWIKREKVSLTKREKEILQFSIRGYTIHEIALATFVSPDTIKFHRKKLFEKLEVSNISEAIGHATSRKLI